MILRFLVGRAALFCFSTSATPYNCGGLGLINCHSCNSPITAAVGTPTLCPFSPGGLEPPKNCVGWRIPASLCKDILGGNCDDDLMCCPMGWTGYFFCNEWIVDNGSGICYPEPRCGRRCCSGTPQTYIRMYDCDGDGVFEAVAQGYSCNIFLPGP